MAERLKSLPCFAVARLHRQHFAVAKLGLARPAEARQRLRLEHAPFAVAPLAEQRLLEGLDGIVPALELQIGIPERAVENRRLLALRSRARGLEQRDRVRIVFPHDFQPSEREQNGGGKTMPI